MAREGAPVVRLDDLFEDQGGSSAPVDDRLNSRVFGGKWWIRTLFIAFALSVVTWGFLWIARVGVSPVLLFLAMVAIGVLAGAVRLVKAEDLPAEVTGKGLELLRDDEFEGPLEGLRHAVAPTDGRRYAIGRWDDRLIWGERDQKRFNALVVPRIAELVDERLRQRHGFTLAADPARARAMLGEPLWELLYRSATRTLSPRDLRSIVAKVEEL